MIISNVDEKRVSKLNTYLKSRTPGSGPSLPAPSGTDRSITLHPPDSEVVERLLQNLKGEAKKWMDIAIKEIGIPPDHRIAEYAASTDLGPQPTSVPWQSMFVNWVMETAGYPGTHSGLGRSWLKWGKESERQIGAIVVFARPNSPGSVVGFYVEENKDKDEILVLGWQHL